MIDPIKIELMAEIERLDKFSKLIDLEKYTVEQLEFHVKKLKEKKGIK
jgi:hypothetical protein